ncbi:LysE family translocator [Psychrobacter sp. 16-MNA-CIBAN-0192]|uniref:LysE family translocator n=1 Tax=Psychrobacter sp. 16-MNA-CIBAN-0192 TaxID=3140448 RepID=UPI00332055DA
MSNFLFLSYILTISAIIASPGPSTALMVSHSISYGRRALVLNSLGSVCAATILILIALLLIDKTIPKNFLPFLSIIGSVYLLYIGYKSIFSNKVDIKRNTEINNFFSQAFFTGISNPKDIIFFLIFLPQFIDHSFSFIYSALLLVFGWIFCDTVIMMTYGLVAIRARNSLSSGFILKITNMMGWIIIGLGSLLLITSLRQLI